MMFSSSVRVSVRVRIRFSVWLVGSYAHVFMLLYVVFVTLPLETICLHFLTNQSNGIWPKDFGFISDTNAVRNSAIARQRNARLENDRQEDCDATFCVLLSGYVSGFKGTLHSKNSFRFFGLLLKNTMILEFFL